MSFNKFFNKGLKEEDKKEGLWEILKDIEGKNEEHLKAIEDQTKIICRNKIKPPLLKSMYSQVKKWKREELMVMKQKNIQNSWRHGG